MSVRVALRHRTTYRYERAVNLGPQTVRLRPAPHCRTRIESYSLKVEPKEYFLNWQQDPQSNWLARLVFPKPTDELVIDVDLVAEMAAVNPFDFFLEPYAEKWPFEYEPQLREELTPYRRALPSSPRLDSFVAEVPRGARATIDFLVELNRSVSSHVEYLVRLEPGLQTPEETLEKGSGSCRDSAWLLVQVLRRLGLAARFASGYLIQLTADEKPIEGPAGPSKDFCDLHAWCEVYLPGAGWIGLDPTSGLLAGEGHLPLACTAEPALAAPVSGLVDVVGTSFAHEMSVTRVSEVPRVTKPYTEEQWREIVELGRAVDRDLEKSDVRLTMGGEPTFVSVDDFDAAEWNTAALGPKKRKLSIALFRRLKEKYGPKGLVHFGQGKWYPGEPLPRWALSLFFMRDGTPFFEGAVADESSPQSDAKQSGASGADHALAKKLLEGVTRHLGVDASCIFPAYEDALYHVWRERKLPVGVDPADSKLDDPLERARLARIFSVGLDAVVGHALPVARLPSTGAWQTRAWHFRDRCFLVPGDSPMGLRLPLDTKPWLRVQKEEKSKKGAKDEADEYAPLASRAMCVEPRGGVLYVFMPPADKLDDYLALVRAVEKSAAALSVPVMFEGYTPPRDPRIVALSVTPDPGVIEVNIHPSASWDELVERTTHLYEVAREERLSAEKFMVDGRHVGTGGGNHVVLGAAKPDDSPFLRRPDLLRSLLAYFHQHPSLSTMFSGMFIGPTSQAPRVDEARNDSLFELEIAFREVTRMMEKHDGAPPPWTCDRLFRDILVDVTGNTHRAEFCIDKLWSPDSTTGRLGLLEMRGFEMPPHARMSLMQQLLLRALVAHFWKKPYAPARLARWGTELHDRFMLPFFVWHDFQDVLSELSDAGIPLRASFFAPHFEFRFPRLGEVETRGIAIELRAALEPWHVMGEDVTAGGTARFVDSSLERIEVKVSGLPPDRFQVLCNGAPLPLRGAGPMGGTKGEHVCGVRYRAWQPPRCLHPHIPVHAPLTFDLFDTFANRSIGGCRYHVAHPGGRSHDNRPVNALEAEGRRRARFFVTHTGEPPSEGAKRAADARRVTVAPSPDFPFTLDLRRLDPSS